MKSHKFSPVLNRIIISIFLLAPVYAHSQSAKIASQDSINTVEEALKLINMPEPTFKPYVPVLMDSAQFADIGFDQVYESEPCKYVLRDGGYLFAQKYPSNSKTTIILLHGVLSSSYTYNKMSGLLRDAADAQVISIDLRGHGQSSGRPGDVDYIDQYTDDLADVLSKVKEESPNNKIVMAGHSMGGGIILRYVQRKELPKVDAYLLFAPSLGHNAPTLRTSTQENSNGNEAFLKIHISRIMGLYMLNTLGIHSYDSLNVLFFNLPNEVPLRKYSYRSNMSNAPADYKEGLRAIDKPLLVIVGSNDEAYIANEFEPAIKSYNTGKVVLIEGATHNGIRHNMEAMKAVKQWIKGLN